MPRPVSWLPRLHEIRRSVENSVRSHFDRRSLEVLFKLQPSAASSLMDMLPKVQGTGRSLLVKREVLARFLDEVHTAEDVTALCIQQRAEKENVSRKQPRNLVLRDFESVDPASLSPWISRGHLDIRFESIQQLVDILWRIACAVMGDGLEAFCRLYEPEQPVSADRERERAEKRAIDDEIERMDALYKAANFTPTLQRRPPGVATEEDGQTQTKVSA